MLLSTAKPMDSQKRIVTIELTFSIESEHEAALLKTAREGCPDDCISVDQEGGQRPASPEEFIANSNEALLELVTRQLYAEIEELPGVTLDSCSVSSPEDEEGDAEAEAGLEEESALNVDDIETGAYFCRWPNGEFSFICAETRRSAIVALDEWAGAEPCQLTPVENFMADFRLTDSGKIVLNRFGEASANMIWDTCYPELAAAMQEIYSDLEISSGDSRRQIRKAVRRERNRLWANQPSTEPSSELAKQIAAEYGTSALVAEHYVEKTAEEILRSLADDGKKPN